MLSDPQSLTVSGATVSLPRIEAGNMNGRFRNADGSLTLTVNHTNGKRERSFIRLDRSKIGADVLDPTKQRNYASAAWLVLDAPLNGVGFTDAELEADIKALAALITSAGFLTKILGKEA